MLKRSLLFLLAALAPLGWVQAAAFYTVQEVIRPDANFESIEPETSVLTNQGQVLGHAFTRSSEFISFIWDADQGLRRVEDLISEPHFELDEAVDLNDRGVILGAASGDTPFIWDPSIGQIQWIGGSGWMAKALNNHNQVLLLNWEDSEYAVWDYESDGKLIPFGRRRSLWPLTINDQAQVLCWELAYPAFAIWQNGKIVREVKESRGYWPMAVTLNNHGDAVGEWHYLQDDEDREEILPIAVIWPHKGREIRLSEEGQYLEVADINDRLEVVGQDRSVERQRKAFLWSPDEGLIYLRDRVSPGDLVLEDALAINQNGQILAVAQNDVLLLLTPID